MKALLRLGTFKYDRCMSEDKNPISDEAVEAAAKVMYELDYGPVGWEGFPARPRKRFLNDAKKILEAAAPHMLAEAQAAAWESGKDAVWAFLSNQYPQRNRPANPYRSQA